MPPTTAKNIPPPCGPVKRLDGLELFIADVQNFGPIYPTASAPPGSDNVERTQRALRGTDVSAMTLAMAGMRPHGV